VRLSTQTDTARVVVSQPIKMRSRLVKLKRQIGTLPGVHLRRYWKRVFHQEATWGSGCIPRPVPKSHEKQVADLIQVVLERILVEGIRSGAQGLGSLIPKLLGDLNREPGVGDEDSKVGPVGLPPGKAVELVHHEG
jgi:hypothetical protein